LKPKNCWINGLDLALTGADWAVNATQRNRMTTMVSLADVAASKEQLGTPGKEVWRTHFLTAVPGTRDPQAFMVQYAPGRVLRTHFHDVDEFQIVVAGQGTFGRHAIAPFTVHFARAFTPYGPIVAGAEGLTFLTLRARRDSAGPQLLPDQRGALDKVLGRNPWQAAEQLSLAPTGAAMSIMPLTKLIDGSGLAAWVVQLPPECSASLPPAQGSGGQYVVAFQGSIRLGSRALAALAVGFVANNEAPLNLASGAQGATLVVLNFPRHEATVHSDVAQAGTEEVWRCTLCGMEYHVARGQPEFDIAPGTAWNDVPLDWCCSDCHAPKSEFVQIAA
jgi:rubredoxin